MLTLNDLRYLLRLVRCDFWECREIGRSIRVEGKLVEMIGGMKADPLLRVALVAHGIQTETVADQGGRCVGPWTLTMYTPKGGDRVGKTTSKAAPNKKAAAKPTSKTTKRK